MEHLELTANSVSRLKQFLCLQINNLAADALASLHSPWGNKSRTDLLFSAEMENIDMLSTWLNLTER